MAFSFVPDIGKSAKFCGRYVHLEMFFISIASDLKLIALRPLLSSGGVNGLNQVQNQSASYEMNREEAGRQIQNAEPLN